MEYHRTSLSRLHKTTVSNQIIIDNTDNPISINMLMLIEKIRRLYYDNLIDIFDKEDWIKWVIEGKLTEYEIDNAIYQRSHGFPMFNFVFLDPITQATKEC